MTWQVRSELSLTNLDYWTCVLRLLKSNYVFYAVAILHQLFAAFAVRRSTPHAHGTTPCDALTLGWPLNDTTNVDVSDVTDSSASSAMAALARKSLPVAAHAHWLHLATAAAYVLDSALRATFAEYDDAPPSALARWTNWSAPGECSAAALVECLQPRV
jgi:hypothetical protein